MEKIHPIYGTVEKVRGIGVKKTLPKVCLGVFRWNYQINFNKEQINAGCLGRNKLDLHKACNVLITSHNSALYVTV